DRALLNRPGRVRYNEVDIEFDDVAEAMTGRTGAEWVVEREQPGLRVFVRDAARPAFEALGELMDSCYSQLATCCSRLAACDSGLAARYLRLATRYLRLAACCARLTARGSVGDLDRPCGAASFEIRRLDRIREALPQLGRVSTHLHAIHDDLQH